MILPIVTEENLLRIKSELVTGFDLTTQTLITNLMDTVQSVDNSIGLSAIQIGIPKRACVISDDGKSFLILINPEIIEHSRFMSTYQEGCLSLPKKVARVMRYNSVDVVYQDIKGKTQQIHLEGLLSCCCQHEVNHMDAILMIDKAF